MRDPSALVVGAVLAAAFFCLGCGGTGGSPGLVCPNIDYPKDCSLAGVPSPLRIDLTEPSPGSVLAVNPLNVIGNVTRGTAVAVTAGGQSGYFYAEGSASGFTVPAVPVAPAGITVLHVVATAADGSIAFAPLLVSEGAMPLFLLDVSFDDQRQATIGARHASQPTTRGLWLDGAVHYRLLDGWSQPLYEGGVPNSALGQLNECAGDPNCCPYGPIEPWQTSILVPDVPDAVAIVFVDEGGCGIGRSVL
jgi:hypothetical protein